WELVLSRSDEANSQIKWKRSLTAAPRGVEGAAPFSILFKNLLKNNLCGFNFRVCERLGFLGFSELVR
ncbi:hypothetical protein, partial [Cephaloticoccus capnophilus]|uniref:hypothetical protein n=1 Tax=Cephaloticoccus capnophilus TaxID=1548208 RepID=UPI001E393AFC